MGKFILAPSILAADFTCLGEQVGVCEESGAKWLHIDVMDGIFVPNISFGTVVYEKLRKVSKLFFDVHLMITQPERYIDRFIDAGADSVTFHVEATDKTEECIDIIKKRGKKAGISICPGTPVCEIEKYLDKVDMVLVMSVNPGYGGQSYIDDVNEKIKYLRKKMGENFHIQVDGGIYKENIKNVVDCGADVIVAGTAVFGSDIAENIRNLEEAVCGQ